MSDQPVFVVGVPRSGTTLLASILGSHSRLACGPETAYFASLAAANEPLPRPGEWPRDLISFASSARLEGESLLERFAISREELSGLLANKQPSPVGVLEALGERMAAEAGKARWVEKSPIHLLYVREIRYWFPMAPIICIIRDPRDVGRSLTKVPWGAETLLGGFLTYRRFHLRCPDFFTHDKFSYTVRYEELVADPWQTMCGVFAFLGEHPEKETVTGERSTDVLVRAGESWKSEAGDRIDDSRVEGWRGWSPADRRLAEAVLGDVVRELGYPRDEELPDRGWVWLHPSHEVAAGNESLKRELEAGRRLWPSAAGEPARAGVLVGEPDRDDWLGRRSVERLRAVARVAWCALTLRLRGRRVIWYRRPAPDRKGGLAARLLGWALRPVTSVEELVS